MYCSIQEVRNVIGVTSTTQIPDSTINQSIEWAEDEIDRLTNTTYYPVEDLGTVTTGAATLITDNTKSWIADAYIGYAVYIYDGLGKGQIREITDNAATTLTTATWTTTPDTTSKYYITYYNKITETYDGNNKNYMMLRYQPVIQLDSLSVDGTTVTPSTVYLYNNVGKLGLSTTSEVSLFTPDNQASRQIVSVTYWYGVLAEKKRTGYPLLPQNVMRLCSVIAGIKAISYQLGGSYNQLNSFGLPDFTGSTAPAYAQYKAVIDNLNAEVKFSMDNICGKFSYMG